MATWPFRYGMTIPALSLTDWLVSHGRLVTAALASVRGCVEVTVKLLRLDGAITRQPPGWDRGRVVVTPPGRDERELRSLADTLAERAGASQWRYYPSGRAGNVAASAAFLVPRADVQAFLARIAPVASHATGIAVVPTGPGVPYSFVPELDRAPLARLLNEALATPRRAG
jgi:Gas vesicle synthesis protein GvpL/GvpF